MTKIKLYIVLLFLGVGLQQTYSQIINKTSGVLEKMREVNGVNGPTYN
jgi:hypothetical protein